MSRPPDDRSRSSRWESFYAVIRKIPPGRVATYGQIATLAGFDGHARQVGYALAALPDGSDLPWQRIVNSKGEISQRSPEAMPGTESYQRHLLEREGVRFDQRGTIPLSEFLWEPQPDSMRSGRGRVDFKR